MPFYLSAHPLDEYLSILEKNRVQLFGGFEKSVESGASAGKLAGTVISKQERKTRTGRKIGIITLSDPTGQYEAILFEELLVKYRDLLEPGNLVMLHVAAEKNEEGISVRIQEVFSLETIAAGRSQNMRIFVRDEKPVSGIAQMLKSVQTNGGISANDGQISIIVLEGGGAMEVEIVLAKRAEVSPKICSAIKSLPGVFQAELL